jgi:hypothetical protein
VSALFQFQHDGAGEPTPAGLAERYGVDVTAFDREYGVVLVDEAAGLWVALVDDDVAERLQAALTDDDVARGAGVFSNPVIEPTDDDTGGDPTAWS